MNYEGTVTISLERYEDLKKNELILSDLKSLMNVSKPILQKYCDRIYVSGYYPDENINKELGGKLSKVLQELMKIVTK